MSTSPTQQRDGQRRGEDLRVRTFNFALAVIKLCQALERTGQIGRVLGDQLLRSGTSVGANVEEAQAGHSRADFIAKMTIAQKEARESHYWLRLLRASNLSSVPHLDDMIREADELVRILSKVVVTAKENR